MQKSMLLKSHRGKSLQYIIENSIQVPLRGRNNSTASIQNLRRSGSNHSRKESVQNCSQSGKLTLGRLKQIFSKSRGSSPMDQFTNSRQAKIQRAPAVMSQQKIQFGFQTVLIRIYRQLVTEGKISQWLLDQFETYSQQVNKLIQDKDIFSNLVQKLIVLNKRKNSKLKQLKTVQKISMLHFQYENKKFNFERMQCDLQSKISELTVQYFKQLQKFNQLSDQDKQIVQALCYLQGVLSSPSSELNQQQQSNIQQYLSQPQQVLQKCRSFIKDAKQGLIQSFKIAKIKKMIEKNSSISLLHEFMALCVKYFETQRHFNLKQIRSHVPSRNSSLQSSRSSSRAELQNQRQSHTDLLIAKQETPVFTQSVKQKFLCERSSQYASAFSLEQQQKLQNALAGKQTDLETDVGPEDQPDLIINIDNAGKFSYKEFKQRKYIEKLQTQVNNSTTNSFFDTFQIINQLEQTHNKIQDEKNKIQSILNRYMG